MSALETIGLQQINKKIPKHVLPMDVATTMAETMHAPHNIPVGATNNG